MKAGTRSGTAKPLKVVFVLMMLLLALAATYEFSSKSGGSSFPFGFTTSTSTTTPTGTHSSTRTSTLSVTHISSSPTTTTMSRTSDSETTTSTLQTTTSTLQTTTSTHVSSQTSSTTVATTKTPIGNATLSCYAGDLKERSSSSFDVNGMTGYRVQFTNPTGGIVVSYSLPLIQSTLPPGGQVNYSLTFAANSTFTGVYVVADLRGNHTILGHVGLVGSKYYYNNISSGTNDISVAFLIPESSAHPYVIGATNSFTAVQVISIRDVIMATCGNSWIAAVSAS